MDTQRIVLESASEQLSDLSSKINTERYWFAGTFISVAIGSLLPWEPVKIFSVVAGSVFAILIFGELLNSNRHHNMWQEARVSAYRMQHGLPLPPHEAKNWTLSEEPVAAPNETARVDVLVTERKSATSVQHRLAEYSNPPTMVFLEWIFACAALNSFRQIPTERVAADYGVQFGKWNTNEANEWLDILDEQGITEKARETKNGNAPRRLVEGVTLADAAARFGLQSPALSDADSIARARN